jgi:DNA polymerase-1
MDPTKEVCCHNEQYEQKVSRIMGIDFECLWRDSMFAQYLLDKGTRGAWGYDLKGAVKAHLKHKMIEMPDILAPGQRFHEISSEEGAPYCADDSLQCLRLVDLWVPEMHKLGLLEVFENLYCPFSEVLLHMEEVGFGIDPDLIQGFKKPWKDEMDAIADDFYRKYKCSISSDKQVSMKMFDELKLWPSGGYERMQGGYFSIRDEVREGLMCRVPEDSPGYLVLQQKSRFSTLQKLVSTYTDSLTNAGALYFDGRIRSNFSAIGTDTGRLSSGKPNLQNVPSRGFANVLRRAFIAQEGWVICDADYSQADLVMMAHLSQDPLLLKAYRESIDLHQQTADNCGCDRPTGKVLNLGIIYEMMEKTLAKNLGISVSMARMIHEKWHHTYPFVGAYHRRQHKFARENGYVDTITGRRRNVPDIQSKNKWLRAFNERVASNTPCQGSVADIINIALRNLHREWKKRGVLYDFHKKTGKAKIISQIHDEVVCELRDDFKEEGMKDIQRHMENAVTLSAPMRAQPGIADNWLDAKKDGERREKEEKSA